MKHQDQAGSSKKAPSQPGATSEAKVEKQQQQAGKSKQMGAKNAADNQQQSNANGRKAQKQQS